MHATSLEYVAPAVPARRCHSAHHDQGQKLAKEQVRGGGSHQPPDQAPVAGKESGLNPPGLLVLECGHDRAQKKTPPQKKKKSAG